MKEKKGIDILFELLLFYGISIILFGTIGLLCNNYISYAYIINTYKNIAFVKYLDIYNIEKVNIINLHCTQNKYIPISYSILNSDKIYKELPWIKFEDAISLYRLGLFLILFSFPFLKLNPKHLEAIHSKKQ
jgi:hypothetical protein